MTMRTNRLTLLSGTALAAALLGGCNNSPETTASDPTPVQAVKPAPGETTNPDVPEYDASPRVGPEHGNPLATEQAAGPFMATLISKQNPVTVGTTEFRGLVKEKTLPLRGARVIVHFTGPKGSVASTVLAPQGPEYLGDVELETAGPWRAKMEIQSGALKGTADYEFEVVPKP
ncbi:MAG: hypothetical protein KY468_16945 [Armatimonadetes bacterium]|nr:hypothetical protein [Armatimonadota bacterium]